MSPARRDTVGASDAQLLGSVYGRGPFRRERADRPDESVNEALNPKCGPEPLDPAAVHA